jgi:hypothetical protein
MTTCGGLSQARLKRIPAALRRAPDQMTQISDDFLTLAYQAIDD